MLLLTLSKSVFSPKMGVLSILKSPVWTILILLVFMISPHESGIEWTTGNQLMEKKLKSYFLFIFISFIWFNWFLLSFFFIISFVSAEQKIGTFRKSNFGNAPIWSSCPCVINIPLIFSRIEYIYSKSGRIMSISLSSAENLMPASIMNISLLISKRNIHNRCGH